MKKKAIIFLSILVIVYSVAFLQMGNNKNGEETFIAAFLNSEFETIQINLNSWGLLNQSFSSIEEMKYMAETITDSLGIYDTTITDEKDSDIFKEITMTKASKNAKTTVKLESIKYEKENTTNTYIIVDITLYGQYESIPYLKQSIDKIFEENDIKPTTNITLTGNKDGKLTKEKKQTIALDILKNLGAKIEETYETDEIYSVYGYTKLIDDWLISNDKKININCAFRYSDYEKKTYVYLATPVIIVDY
ncbi:MAG: hypothetical protein GX308_06980 [Epulopiscium sp.]|nr:hypothetical protein [Candidatus Epulonipiscium sp.]